VEAAMSALGTVDFLTRMHPESPWLVAEIDPNVDSPPVVAREFTDLNALRSHLGRRNGVVNLYFLPNRTCPGITTTPCKDQITYIVALYVDFDLPKTGPHSAQTEANLARLLQRIRALRPAPTLIVYTGGGYQAFWIITKPYPGAEYLDRIETTGKAVARSLGSDAVQNINRWMRLPGTVNLPNATKRARGREPALATMVEEDWSRTWSYDDPVPSLPDGYDDELTSHRHSRCFDDLPVKWQRLVKSGDASGYDDDRSRLIFALALALVARGWSDEEILPFLTDERYGSSAHCCSKLDPAATARRQIKRAREKLVSDWDRTAQGRIDASSPKNVRLALQQMGVSFSHDTFADRYYVNGVGPLRALDDPVESEIRISTHDHFGFLPRKELLRDVTVTLSRASGYLP